MATENRSLEVEGKTYPQKMQRGCSSRHLSGTRNNRGPPSRKPVPYPKGPEPQTAKLASARTQIRPEAKTKKERIRRPDKNPQPPSSENPGARKHWFSTSLAQRHASSPERTRTPPERTLPQDIRHPTTTLTVQTSKPWRTCSALQKQPHRH
ncbi:hypothetical protein QBC45DRAFT_97576 [Copromyces sp. CBS 386.78]|nr:hypothetical protein QBC45DRAFT_97576 [Copromyces sp. CBS 386.78]